MRVKDFFSVLEKPMVKLPHPALIAFGILSAYAILNTFAILAQIGPQLFSEHGFWGAYSLGLVAVFILASVSLWRNSTTFDPIPISWKSILISLPFLAFFIREMMSRYPEHVFWLDEYIQLIGAMEDPASSAAIASQPLLGYLTSHFISYFLRYGILLSRLFSVFTTLAAWLFAIAIGNQLRLQVWFYIMVGALFATESNVLYSALEARSVSLGLMLLGLLWLNGLFAWFTDHPLARLGVGVSAFLFLMALGMQPVVLTALWLFALTAYWLATREKRILNIIQGMALALIAFAPFQFVIHSISAANHKFNSDRSSRFAEWLNTFRFDTYLYYFNEKRNFYLFALTGAFALSALIYRRRFFPKPIWILTAAIFMFPVVFDGFFHTYINWILNPWYRTCFLVTANIFLFALFTAPSNKKMRPVVGLASIAIAGLVMSNSNLKGNYGKDGSLRIDFTTMYRKISETLQSDDWSAYVVGECYTKTSSGWCFDAFIGAEILENRPGQLNLAYSRVREMVTVHDNGMVKDALSSSQLPRYTVAVIVDEDWKNEMIQKQIDARKNDIFIIPNERYVVVGLKKMSPPKDGINDLLITLTQIFSNDPDYMYPYELLARIAVLSGRRSEAKNWWKKILAMKGIDKLREDHPVIRQRLIDLEQFLSNDGESH